jgi:hypothetical protein
MLLSDDNPVNNSVLCDIVFDVRIMFAPHAMLEAGLDSVIVGMSIG